MCQIIYKASIQHSDVKQNHTEILVLQWQQTRYMNAWSYCYFQRYFPRTQSLKICQNFCISQQDIVVYANGPHERLQTQPINESWFD